MEVLDRVLDRGIVIDAEMRFNVAGLNVAGLEARIVVAAIETYLDYADEIALTAPASWRTIADDSGADPTSGRDAPTGHRLGGFFDDLDQAPWLGGDS